MNGETNLSKLLQSMQPRLQKGICFLHGAIACRT